MKLFMDYCLERCLDFCERKNFC